MKEIQLTQGKVALIDDEDYKLLVVHKWHIHMTDGKLYAGRAQRKANGKYEVFRMQWAIMGAKHIDHVDGNGLNNQRYNLRKSTILQNTQNRTKTTSATTSIYKGVYKNTAQNRTKWSAYITVNKKRIWLGQFDLEIDAARCYDERALKEFGEFSKLNFPKENYGTDSQSHG